MSKPSNPTRGPGSAPALRAELDMLHGLGFVALVASWLAEAASTAEAAGSGGTGEGSFVGGGLFRAMGLS